MLQKSIHITRRAVYQRAAANLEMASQEIPSDLPLEDYIRGLTSWISDDSACLESRMVSLAAIVTGRRCSPTSTRELVTPIVDAIQQIAAARKLLRMEKTEKALEEDHERLYRLLERWERYFEPVRLSVHTVNLCDSHWKIRMLTQVSVPPGKRG